MAKIYAPNEDCTRDLGVEFINGVAVIPDAKTDLIAWFEDQGYTAEDGEALLLWDYLSMAFLAKHAQYLGVNPAGMKKHELVVELHEKAHPLPVDPDKVTIVGFDAINMVVKVNGDYIEIDANEIDGGDIKTPVFANAEAVQAVLPVTVVAELSSSIKIILAVEEWEDTDIYDVGAAGDYTFTAQFDNLPFELDDEPASPDDLEVIVTIKVEQGAS